MISFREMNSDDLALFEEWLYAPHVARWFHDADDWMEEVEKRDSEFSWISHFIVECDGKPIGFCQYYNCDNSDEDWAEYTEKDGTYSIDYLIGDKDYLRQGIGKQIVSELLRRIKLHRDAKRIVVSPEKENGASCGLLKSCGFSYNSDSGIFVIEL